MASNGQWDITIEVTMTGRSDYLSTPLNLSVG